MDYLISDKSWIRLSTPTPQAFTSRFSSLACCLLQPYQITRQYLCRRCQIYLDLVSRCFYLLCPPTHHLTALNIKQLSLLHQLQIKLSLLTGFIYAFQENNIGRKETKYFILYTVLISLDPGSPQKLLSNQLRSFVGTFLSRYG